MQTATRHPIDYDALAQGHTITQDELKRITNCKPGTKQYQLKCLALQSQIEREMRERGRIWTIKIEKDEIRILTDAEASPYNHALQVQARGALFRRFALNSAVNIAELTEDQRKEHDRFMEVDGKYVLALQATRQQLRLKAHKRATPALS